MKSIENKEAVEVVNKAFDEYVEMETMMSDDLKGLFLIGLGVVLQNSTYHGVEFTELVLEVQKYVEGLE